MIVQCKISHLKNDTFFTTVETNEDYVLLFKNKMVLIGPSGRDIPSYMEGKPYTPAWYSKNALVIADSSRVRTRFQRFFGLNK
ncbi:hypothetical protein PS2_063 [Serratia phage PS2]|uniref:Uncharacterized protein n=1 Tax=Serratia phage PS2 TaxID=1481112 RepID=A0A023W4Y6_9CAUD|nr:hypothetical protein FF83_gp063 [Serratia phage PS2]AHY25310.1 hypothetical protein PS2_063 [Serratia phage PS2]